MSNEDLSNKIRAAQKAFEDAQSAKKKTIDDEKRKKEKEQKDVEDTFRVVYKGKVAPAMKEVKNAIASGEKGVRVRLFSKDKYQQYLLEKGSKGGVGTAFVEVILVEIVESAVDIEIISLKSENYDGVTISVRNRSVHQNSKDVTYELPKIPETSVLATKIVDNYIKQRYPNENNNKNT